MANKLKIFTFLAIFAILSLKYSHIARQGVTNVTNEAISSYLWGAEYLREFIDKHFEQKEYIEQLIMENKKLKHSQMLMKTYKGKLNNILLANKKVPFGPDVELVEALSYEHISNYTRVWIKMNDFNASKIYGLIKNGSTAGIVAQKDGKALALLQGDRNCVFSVAIGKDRLPGVANGRGEFIHVKYIPLWMEPNVGDEVITSGLDKIFMEGISVGKVVDVKRDESYKVAIVKPYTTITTPDFFYVIK